MTRLAIPILLVAVACGRDRPAEPGPAAGPPGYCRRAGTYIVAPSSLAAPPEGADSGPAPLGGATGSAIRPANTFSIVARDPVTGDLGVAVQSHWFSVGSLVTWAEPGVGAVATQSFVEPAYGPRGLALMRDGTPAADAMARLVAADAQQASRQLGFVDAQGRAAAHTGARCIQYAGHHVGAGYTVQANLMGNDRVVPAMQAAFEAAKGDLAERMLAALDAAQAAGGDLRGCQSAAILVVGGARTETPWAAKKLDLRVEDSAAPLVELRRLVTLARAYDHMNQGDAAVETGDMKGAVEHYGTAARMVPGSAEMVYWQGVALAGHGQLDAARPLLQQAFTDDPAWLELTRRLPAAGLLDAKIADELVGAKPR